MQFLGPRACHSSVAVVQLAVVLVISLVRAGLRTERLNKKENFMARGADLSEGFELDRLALRIAAVSKEMQESFWFCVWTSPPQNELEIIQGDLNWTGGALHVEAKAFAYRKRLAQLTGAVSLTTMQSSSWDENQVKVRKTAGNLARVIQMTMDIFYDSNTARLIILKKTWDIPVASRVYWTIWSPSSSHSTFKDCGKIHLSVKQNTLQSDDELFDGTWSADISELEAVLGLWL